MSKKDKKYDIGKIFLTNEGYSVEIIEILDRSKVRIRFLYDIQHESEVFTSELNRGIIKNPYHPSVYGIGYIGIGDYKVSAKRKKTVIYSTWSGMLERCYNEKCQKISPTYIGCKVASEWYNFQTFAKWYNDNYPKHIEGIKFELDKDVMQRNSKDKIYSAETCVFLPCNVNTFIENKLSNNTSGKIGVHWCNTYKKWISQVSLFGENKRICIGRFLDLNEASEFYDKARKEQLEKAKDYLRSLNYLPEEIIQLIKTV